MIELIGWTASVLFAICAAPQSIACYQQGHAKGLDPKFIWMWFIAEILMMIYVPLGPGWNGPIMFNLMGNTFFLLVILRYMYYPRRDDSNRR